MSGSKTKKPNLFRTMKKRIKLVWKGDIKGPKAVVAHPIEFYRTLETGRKMGSKKNTKGRNIGTTIRTRIVNGPELNILFLGIPFIIDCAVSTAQMEHKRKKDKRKLRKLLKGGKGGSSKKALPPAPHSDKFVKVRNSFIELGMSEEGAELITSGGLGDDAAEDHLSEHDLGVLAVGLLVDTVGETEQDEERMDEVLE
jgi:hypothetical protein